VDLVTERAIADYHALLRDDRALREELEANFLAKMRSSGITFGGRVLCAFARPSLVSVGVYEQIRGVCRGIFRAIEKVDRALGERLWDLVDLQPEERELVAVGSGYGRASPLSRLDSFLTPSAYQFVELNAETPAGGAYAEALAEVFLDLPVIRKFQERYALRRFRTQERLLETLLRCYREAGGRAEHPTIAVADYDDVPTRTEHHLVARYFESKGCPALVCDPRQLVYEGGALRHDDRAIDIVYKRLLVNEFLERRAHVQALFEAVRDHAVVMVNPFRCKPIHKKAIFAVLTDDELQKHFTDEERTAIRAHVPWTRRVQEGRTTRHGETLDLPSWIVAHRERLVMKPNDEYGGKGVFIGWETTPADWEAALTHALRSSYVVQEKVELLKQPFPELAPDLRFRDFVVDLDPYVFDGEVEGFLARLSGTSLANVTSGGGQVPAFLVEPRG
jgi:uncharacterized circularly permuted ATP-grasp superfamily protein